MSRQEGVKMFKIGRYGIAFGRYFWFQTRVPTTVRRFLCFLIFKEAHLDDTDSKKEFPIGTRLEYEGIAYRYCKAGADIVIKGEEVP